MTEVKNVSLVQDSKYGDWVVLYVNGEVAAEGHSLDERQVLEALGISFDSYEVSIEDLGGAPTRIEDFKERVEKLND